MRVILFVMNLLTLKRDQKGFTLLEIMIVVGIIGILVSVVGINASESGQRSRDARRQADLKILQASIELYKNKNGNYPEGCRGANNWSGQQGTSYACSGTDTQYIIGLAPEFIPVLPADKKLNGTNSGYVYVTNASRTTYKVMAMNTVEIPLPATVEAYLHPLKSCDMSARLNSDGSISDTSANSWCSTVSRDTSLNANCRYTSTRFQRSYGVWGGFAPCTGSCSVATGGGANNVEAMTELITCK